ncbi:MAG TPA: phosphatase PAP2 family protein, partial [Chloroflexota bacterium]|nr:phosphatase PAP2 family protein [Chloroflexota bacterium]
SAVEVGLMLLVLVRGGRLGPVARMLAAVGLIYGLSDLLGRVAPRQRPFVSLADVEALVAHSTERSFPSRHVASGLAMGSIARGGQPGLGVLMTLVAGLLGAARVAAGLHYPSDVLAGLTLGALVGRLLR